MPRTWTVLIPFIAGQWSLHLAPLIALVTEGDVLIPFIAGQWSLRSTSSRYGAWHTRLNPLHCGAVVASRRPAPPASSPPVLITFIAGQWSLQAAMTSISFSSLS